LTSYKPVSFSRRTLLRGLWSILKIGAKGSSEVLGMDEQVSVLCTAALVVSHRNSNRHKCSIISRTGYIGVAGGEKCIQKFGRETCGKEVT
jgi:hypothetical protein